MGEILKRADVVPGSIVEFNGEIIELIQKDGELFTYIEEEIEYTDPDKDTNPLIFGKERWRCVIHQPTPFSSGPIKLNGHRTVSFMIGNYKRFTKTKDKTVISTKNIEVDDDNILYPESNNQLLTDKFIYGAPMCSKEEMDRYQQIEKFVVQLYMDGKECCVWNSVKDAAEEYGLHAPNIYACLSGIRHSCGGFRWKWRIIKNFKL